MKVPRASEGDFEAMIGSCQGGVYPLPHWARLGWAEDHLDSWSPGFPWQYLPLSVGSWLRKAKFDQLTSLVLGWDEVVLAHWAGMKEALRAGSFSVGPCLTPTGDLQMIGSFEPLGFWDWMGNFGSCVCG